MSVKKNVASLAIFTLLLLGMVSFAFDIKPAKSEWTGTVYIRADGSIDPPNAPIITYDKVTYTLIGDITSTGNGIVVQRDNVVIDGAGYDINGAGGGTGVDLSDRKSVVVKNLTIAKFAYGVYLGYWGAKGNLITLNKIVDNEYGIYTDYFSDNNIIVGNLFANNEYGIDIHTDHNVIFDNHITTNYVGILIIAGSSDNNVTGNFIINNKIGISVDGSYFNVVSDNYIVLNGEAFV